MRRIIYGDELMHYGRSKRDGAPVGSGRYPLGSGNNVFQPTALTRTNRNASGSYRVKYNKNSRANRYSIGTDDLSDYSKDLNSISNDMTSMAKKISSYKPTKKRLDLSSMTDQELQAFIRRQSLEENYAKYYNSLNPSKIDIGKDHVKDVLETGAIVLGAGASALGIAVKILQLKGKI